MKEVLDQMIESIPPAPLNTFQMAIKKSKEPLKDDVTYEATLVRVEDYETKNGTPVLSYVYDVNGVEVKDTYFFSTYSMQRSIDRLISTLRKFGHELNIQEANLGVESLRCFTKYLVGSKVKLVQKTTVSNGNTYFSIEIVAVDKLVDHENEEY